MKTEPKIFRTYDIRGIYPTEVSEDLATHVGKAYGSYLLGLGIKNIVVGRDNRASSPVLTTNLINGLLSTGINVTDSGIVLTPMISFYTCTQGFNAGIMVTASHNPKEYNGFRFVLKDALPFFGDDIKKLAIQIDKENYKVGNGVLKTQDLSATYVDYLKSKFNFARKLKVVINCGNGASSEIGPLIFKALGCDVIPVMCSFDSSFPNGVPDPENPVYMKVLSEKVQEFKADIGICFDTDGDRAGIVDENGLAYETDKLLLFFAQDMLPRIQNVPVVFDVKSTGVLDKEITRMGGVPERIRTGHTYFIEAIKDGAMLGAELSGHIYFADEYFGFDDGVYAACRALRIVAMCNCKLSELMQFFPKRYHTLEVKVPCDDTTKFTVIEKMKNIVVSDLRVRRLLDIDGIRVEISEHGWFLIRPSNTTPLISIRFEGVDMEEVKYVKSMVCSLLKNVGLDCSAVENSEVILS